MKKLTKIVLIAILSLTASLSAVLVGCGGQSTLQFTATTPTTVTYNSEIYFREYINVKYGEEYELYVSYTDPETGVEVKDEKQDSLLFRFDKVANYSFTIKKVGENSSITCNIDCYPELPRFEEFSEYLTFVGDSLVFNDLMFWCGVSIKNSELATSDPAYTYQFKNVLLKSINVNGEDKVIDLSSKSLSDTFIFEEEAIYEFNVVAKNKLGEVPFVLTANTADTRYHINEVSGYVFEDNKTIEFSMSQILDKDIPEDGASLDVRMEDVNATAVYDARTKKFTVEGFNKDVENGEPLRLYVEGKTVGYSVLVVAPDLVLTQQNIRKLETVVDGYVVLNEDIDMSQLQFSEEEIANRKNYWGSTRTGNYADYMFRGMFDGQGHTIRNFKTGGASYSCGLFWSVDGAVIKNINFEKVSVNGWNSVVCGRAVRKARFENITVEVASMSTKNSSIITGPTESDVEYTNVLMYVASLDGEPQTGTSFFGGFYTYVIKATNVFCVTDTALPDKPSHASITAQIHGSYKRVTKQDAINGTGISINEMPTDLLKSAYDRLFVNYMIRLDESNIGLLQTATSGDYWLNADIDMNNVDLNGDGVVNGNDVWSPTSTFVGTLDGQGYTIKNFKGASLFNGFNGKIKDINMIDISYLGAKGFIAGVGNVSADVSIENAVFSFVEVSGKSWMSLVGYQVGGEMTLTNVYVEMPATTSEHIGMITCHAVTGINFNNVYMVGGTGSYHSNSSGNSANYTPDNPQYGKGIDGEEGVDYFYYVSTDEIIEGQPELPENIQNAVDDKLICKVNEISAANIGDLQTATNGYFVLTEDIDFATAFTGTWTPETTFAGVLNGQGYTISNFNGKNLFNGFNGKVKNVNFIGINTDGQKGFLSANNVTSEVFVENSVFTFASMNTGAWTSLVGYLVGGVANIKNTYIEMPLLTNDRLGFISTNCAAGYVLDQVFMVGGNGSIHSTNSGNNANYVPDNPTYGKGFVGVEGEDYFIGSSAVELVLDKGAQLTENVVTAIDKGYIAYNLTEITAENFGDLQTATNGYYYLSEDIDFATAFTGTWTPSGTFAGVLDGRGFTISNFTGNNLFSGFNGTVKNINFIDVAFEGQKGFLSANNVTSEVFVENAVFTFASLNNGAWTSLVGYLTGGVANIKNTYIEMPASTNDKLGFISAHAGSGYVLDQVFMVGGTGSVHSTSSSNNANYVHDNPTYGKGFVGAEGEDYFIGSSAVEIAIEQKAEFTENVSAAIEKGYIAYQVLEINAENFGDLQTATGGYFVLTEDIDFATAFTGTWTPSSTFTGVLNGDGHTVKNFTGTRLFQGFGGKVKNVNFTDVTFKGDRGFLSWNGIGSTVYLENTVFTFKTIENGSWTCLVGFLTGGVANVKNTYIQMPASTSEHKGFISSNSGSGYVLDQVFMVGGTGSVHSTSSSNNKNYVPDNPTYGKGFIGAEGVDYFFTKTVSECLYDLGVELPENVQKAVDDNVIVGDAIELNAANIKNLLTATSGYYILTEDIDLTAVDLNGDNVVDANDKWATTVAFAGVLNGNGKTISNLVPNSGGSGLFHTCNGTIKNLNVHVPTLPHSSGIFGRIANGAEVDNVSVVVDNSNGWNCGLFMAVQGDITVNNVSICVVKNSGSARFIAGQAVSAGKNITISEVKLFGTLAIAADEYLAQIVGTDGQQAVAGEDYVLYNADIANAIEQNANEFIKAGYAKANA